MYLSIHHNAGINGGSGGGIVAYVAPSHQKQSEVVRDAVYRYTVAATGLRGNRAQPLAEQSLYVLNYTTMPATLIELGFMDSTTDTPIILTERFADEAAAGLAAALVDGLPLRIEGGSYQLCDGKEEACGCGGCRKHLRACSQKTLMEEEAHEDRSPIG